jgi:mercuric ion binding protein
MFRIAFLLSLLLTTSQALAAERTVRMHVENMTCVLCPITVRTTMERVPGVKDVKVNLESKTATVVFDDTKATVGEIEEASRQAGYPASLQE